LKSKYFFRNFNLRFLYVPPHPLPLPVGEREGVRGDFKYLWLEFRDGGGRIAGKE
jgi:hypothetical protein